MLNGAPFVNPANVGAATFPGADRAKVLPLVAKLAPNALPLFLSISANFTCRIICLSGFGMGSRMLLITVFPMGAAMAAMRSATAWELTFPMSVTVSLDVRIWMFSSGNVLFKSFLNGSVLFSTTIE